jgi:hypothetical protein
MSRFGFNASGGPIFVRAEVTGPLGTVSLRLLLDTGATTSLVNLAHLLALGFDPDQSPRRTTMTTGSTVQTVPIVVLTRLSALGQHRFGVPVIAHALPAQSGVAGLIGLDFFRGQSLTIDFRAGEISLS